MNGVNRIQYVTFRAAQRGEAQTSKLRLQLANVVITQGKIVREIPSALAVRLVKREMPILEGRLCLQHVPAERREFV